MAQPQKGYLWHKGPSWFGRWQQDVLDKGVVVRKSLSRRLGPFPEMSQEAARTELSGLTGALNNREHDARLAKRAAEYFKRRQDTLLMLETGIIQDLRKTMKAAVAKTLDKHLSELS